MGSEKQLLTGGTFSEIDHKILRTYMTTILDSVYLTDGRVSSIVFKNGLTHKFIYKRSPEVN